MAIEQLIQSVLSATPAKRRKLEAVLNGSDSSDKHTEKTELKNITQTAKLLGVARNTVYDLMKTGQLDVVDVCGAQRITLQSILEFSRGERPATEATTKLVAEKRAKSKARYAERKAKAKKSAAK